MGSRPWNFDGERRSDPRRDAGTAMHASLLRSVPALAALVLCACASIAPGGLPAGTPIAEARASFLGPTGEYPLPNGGTRLEFARGAFGKQTFMLDFDASGRLVTSQQVLTEANFASIDPGLPAQEVRMRLGRPAEVFNVPWQRLQVWNYRYWPGDCVWYQVSIGPDGRVTESNYGTDPACNPPSSRQ
jgi:hypothetical protein